MRFFFSRKRERAISLSLSLNFPPSLLLPPSVLRLYLFYLQYTASDPVPYSVHGLWPALQRSACWGFDSCQLLSKCYYSFSLADKRVTKKDPDFLKLLGTISSIIEFDAFQLFSFFPSLFKSMPPVLLGMPRKLEMREHFYDYMHVSLHHLYCLFCSQPEMNVIWSHYNKAQHLNDISWHFQFINICDSSKN